MFELTDDITENISVIVIAIGTVGCKIVKSISGFRAAQERVKTLYLHSSPDYLKSLTDDEKQCIALNDLACSFEHQIRSNIQGKDLAFVVAGLGGETGSSVSPHVTRIVRDCGILCVGLFSFPFQFEGRKRIRTAQQAYKAILESADSLVCIENDKFLNASLKRSDITTPNDLFRDSNNHFEAVIKGIVDLIALPGMINVDFGDLKSIISDMGLSTVGFARQKGDLRAENAIEKLLESPALQSHEITEAKGCIVSISAGVNMTLGEFTTVGNMLEEVLGDHAVVVVGTVIDKTMDDDFEVVALLTGLPKLYFDGNFDDESFDIVSISRSILFEPHQSSAGLSILSYFNDFLHQRYSGIRAKVKIEQNGNFVKLQVEAPSGEIESIEKSLSDYGLVVVGEKTAREVLGNALDAERLQMKLEMAAMELRYSEKLILRYQAERDDFKSRITSLESQLASMQKAICNSLDFTQNELSKELKRNGHLPKELLNLIKEGIEGKFDVSRQGKIKKEIIRHKDDEETLITLRKIVENTMYGVSGNSVFSFITSILNSLPK